MPGGAASADPKVLHLLNRLSLGPRPGDIQKVEAIGIESYIQQQLAPEQIPEPPSLGDRLSQLASLKLSPVELVQQYRQQQQQQQQNPQAAAGSAVPRSTRTPATPPNRGSAGSSSTIAASPPRAIASSRK